MQVQIDRKSCINSDYELGLFNMPAKTQVSRSQHLTYLCI